MNMTRSVLAALLVAVVVPAQARDASTPPAKLADYDKLVAEWTAAKQTSQEAMKALRESDAYKEAAAAKDNKKLGELSASVAVDAKGFGTRALALADKHTGDTSLKVLAFAATIPDKDTATAVAERVEKTHLKSAKLGELLEDPRLLSRNLGEEKANKLLARVVAESPHALPKAWAKYWQGQAQLGIQRSAQGILGKKDATDEEKAKATADKAKATELANSLFGEAAKLSAGTPEYDIIGAPSFEKTRLQIGMEIPDIVGEDVDGVAFKLSDYRGKVVVLDYWGFW